MPQVMKRMGPESAVQKVAGGVLASAHIEVYLTPIVRGGSAY